MGILDRLAQISRANKENWDSHISDEVRGLVSRPERISLTEYENLRVNAYEREEIYPRLTDHALIAVTERFLASCTSIPKRHGRDLPVTYDDGVKVLANLLIERLVEHNIGTSDPKSADQSVETRKTIAAWKEWYALADQCKVLGRADLINAFRPRNHYETHVVVKRCIAWTQKALAESELQR